METIHAVGMAALTGLVGAAWQKPKFYMDHLTPVISKVFFALFVLLITWDLAIDVAVDQVPAILGENEQKAIQGAIDEKSVWPDLYGFVIITLALDFCLYWMAVKLSSSEEN